MYPKEKIHSVIQLFDAQVELHPGNVAIQESNGNQITYESLSHSVSSLAGKLWKDYIETSENPFVAILVESRKDFISSAMAVLKCGKAFVPLDLEHPPDRTLGILADLNNPILISTSTLPALNFLNYSRKLTFLLDESDLILDGGLLPRKEWPSYDEHDIMYCLYTSGSTGTPKGVLIEHCSVLNWIEWSVRGKLYSTRLHVNSSPRVVFASHSSAVFIAFSLL